MLTALLLIGISLALVACGDGGGQTVSGEFVGSVEGRDDLLVAVVADSPNEDGKRQIKVYTCDGKQIAEWFETEATDANTADITAESGEASVHVELSEGSVSGTLSLAEGSPMSFEASKATGIAGLYTIVYTDEGLSGSSVGGVTLDVQFGSEDAGYSRDSGEIGTVAVHGAFKLPNGEEHTLPPDDVMTIYLDGQRQELRPSEKIGNSRYIVTAEAVARGAELVATQAIRNALPKPPGFIIWYCA